MKNLLRQLLIVICATGLVVMLGCSALQNVVTPCYIEPEAIEYSEEQSTSFMPYTTIWDALRIGCKMGFLHGQKQKGFARQAEDDRALFLHLNGLGETHIANAEEFKNNVFNAQGPIGFLFTTAFGGYLGTTLLSKPADKKKIAELEKKLNGGA